MLLKNSLKKSNSSKAEKLIILSKTRKITEDDLIHPEWSDLNDIYKDDKDPEWREWSNRAKISVVNAILNQRRMYFVITRKEMRELLKSDKNWKKSAGLKNDNYSILLRDLYHSGIIEKVYKGKNSSVYRVILKEILDFLQVDEQGQLLECKQFADAEPTSEDDLDSENYPDPRIAERFERIEAEQDVTMTIEELNAL